MKQEDNFYNMQLVLNMTFIVLALLGLMGFMGDFKTIMLEFVVVILKQDLYRTEFKKFVDRLEMIEE